MMHYNRISVIVATYNQEETIGRTLDSLRAEKALALAYRDVNQAFDAHPRAQDWMKAAGRS